MSVEKYPLTSKQFDKILEVATRTSEEARRVILFLRYTGMHVSVLAHPQHYNLRVEEGEIVWNRPKKNGKTAHTAIPKSQNLDYDVEEFIEDLHRRKRKRTRKYFYELVRKLGERAGISGLSPMSLRHTVGVEMLNMGFTSPEVGQILNCSNKTLQTYVKHSNATRIQRFKQLRW